MKKVRPVLSRALTSCEAADAGLDRGIEIVDADAKHAVHLAHVETDAAADSVDVALKRRARAEGDDGEMVAGADLKDAADFLGGLREADEVGQGGRVAAFAVAVMLAHRQGGSDAVADDFAQLGERGLDCGWA